MPERKKVFFIMKIERMRKMDFWPHLTTSYSSIWIVSFHKIKPNRNVFLIGVTIIFSPS